MNRLVLMCAGLAVIELALAAAPLQSLVCLGVCVFHLTLAVLLWKDKSP